MKQWAIGLMSNDEKRNILDQHKSLYDGYRTMQPQVSNTQPLYVQDFANDKAGVTVNNKFDVKTYTNVGINEQVEKESMCSECGGVMMEGECSECGWNEGEMEEQTQQVKNLKNVEDLNLSDKFDYVEELEEDDAVDADALQSLTGQEAPHMYDDMAPDGMDDDSDNDRKMMADGEMYETNQGNPYDNKQRAYTFTSKGPKDSGDAYSIKADDMDLDDSEVQKPFDFASQGAVKEFENMESAWTEEEIDEDAYVIGFDGKPRDKKPGEKISAFSLKDFEDDSWEEIHPEDDSLDIDDDIKESVLKQKNRIVEMMNRMKGFN